jgi:hypothetical protein
MAVGGLNASSPHGTFASVMQLLGGNVGRLGADGGQVRSNNYAWSHTTKWLLVPDGPNERIAAEGKHAYFVRLAVHALMLTMFQK